MKRILTIAAIAAGTFIFAGSAMAAVKTSSVLVQANVAAVCSAITAPATVTFTLDPAVGTPVTVSNNVTFRCSKTTPYALTKDLGLNSGSCAGVNCMTDGAANFINYSIVLGGTAVGAGTGMGAGQDKTVTMDATVASLDYVNAAPGVYNDTMVLTLTY